MNECPRCEDILWLRLMGESDALIAARLGLSRDDAVIGHLRRHGQEAAS